MDCGVVGIYGHPNAAELVQLGLHALQHRGQESAGIASSNDAGLLRVHRGLGWVSAVFTPEILRDLDGERAIGHNRYSTAGGKEVLTNAQPLLFDDARGGFALAHNGNLVNAQALRRNLEAEGVSFGTTVDTEVIGHLIARAHDRNFLERVVGVLPSVEGAYSLLLLTPARVIAVRDPHGFRPLVLGELDGTIVVASETCAFDIMGATYIRDIAPGEVFAVSGEGIQSRMPFPLAPHRSCIFERIYFARPDSIIEGRSAYDMRRAYGRKLAREHPAAADVVIPVPDSGVPAALGYAEESGLPFQMGLIRSHYVGRTFIEPRQEIRDAGVRLKFNPERSVLTGQRVVVVDDSIVRGTTSRKLIRMVRRAGAREVHVRISSPPMTGPCIYGIDTPNKNELIAASSSVEEIRAFIGADSLGYLSTEGLHAVTGTADGGACDACFSGRYPVPVAE